MTEMESTVGTDILESAQDDAAQAQDESIAFSEALSDAAEGQQPQEAEEQTQGAKASGGIKGRLMESERKGHDKGYAEGQAAARAEWETMKADYDARLARLAEYELQHDAEELSKAEGCSVELAKRILRAERGMPTPAPKEQPRDAQTGRFVKQESMADDRAKTLYEQAQNIKRMSGVDVLAIFNGDSEVRSKVASGEMDFFDVAREYGQDRRHSTPPVTRSGQAGIASERSIKNLSDDEFDRLDRLLAGGASIDMRR